MKYIIIIALYFGFTKSCPKNGELSNDGTCYYFDTTCSEHAEPIRDEMEFAMVSRLKRGKSKLGRSKVCVSVEHRFFDLLVNQNEPRYLHELRETGKVYFEKNVESGDSVYMGFKIKNPDKPAFITLHNSTDIINYPARIEILSSSKELTLSSYHKTIPDQSTGSFEPSPDAYYEFEIILSNTDFEVDDTLKGVPIRRFRLGSGSADMLQIENIEIWQVEHNPAACKAGGTYGKVTGRPREATDPHVEFERELLHKFTVNADTDGHDVSIAAPDHETRNIRFHLIGPLKLEILLSKIKENGGVLTELKYFVHSGEYQKSGTCYKNLKETGEMANSSNSYTFTMEARKNKLHILIQSEANHQQTKQFTSEGCRIINNCPKIDNVEDCINYYNLINLKSTDSFVAGVQHLPRNHYFAQYCFSDYLDLNLAPKIPYNEECSRKKPLNLCKIREPLVKTRRKLKNLEAKVDNEEKEWLTVKRKSDFVEILEANRPIVITLILLTSTSVLFTLLNCVLEVSFPQK